MAKTAVVIGGTGLVGSHLVRLLAESDEYSWVKNIVRRPLEGSHPKIQNHVVDFEHLEESRELFDGDCLFSCLGTTLKVAGSIEAQRVVDFSYQYQAAKLARENSVSHYLLVSSSGASSANPSPYLKMKGELEDKIKQLDFDKTTIVQPSLLLGERPSKRLLEGVAAKVAPTLCQLPGLRKYRPIYGEVVAKRLLHSSLNAETGFECYRLDEVFI